MSRPHSVKAQTVRQPHLMGLLHGLWPGLRAWRSPILLLIAGALALRFAIPPTSPPLLFFLLSQGPLTIALAVLAYTLARARRRRYFHDWHLTFRSPRELLNPLFRPIWVAWWGGMMALNAVLAFQQWDGVRAALMTGAATVSISTPGTQGISIGYVEDSDLWMVRLYLLRLIASPLIIALWAWMLRWLTEFFTLSFRSIWVGFLVMLPLIFALRIGSALAIDTWQSDVALALQDDWPFHWPLVARLLAGVYLAWSILPASLFILGLLFRFLARRRRQFPPHLLDA